MRRARSTRSAALGRFAGWVGGVLVAGSLLNGCYMRARGCDVGIEYYGMDPVSNSGIDLPLEPVGEVSPMDVHRALRLQAALESAAERTSASRTAVAVLTADGELWSGEVLAGDPANNSANNWANDSGNDAPDVDTIDIVSLEQPPLWWASVGKAFTAMVVIQLVDEGALSLDSAVSTWLPELENGPMMTVRDLLQHTSGLYSFNAIESVRERAGWTEPRELVDAAEREGALFCPGQSWSYTNTGYTVLGLIIEEVTEQSYEDVLLERVLVAPSGPSLDVVHSSEPLTVQQPAGSESGEGGLDADLRTPWAAGAVVGSPEAMVLAWRRFLAGDIVPAGSLRRMFATMYPMFGSYVETYGLGVMVYDLHEADPTQTDRWFGHSGGGLGYQTVVAWSEQTGVTIAVALQNPVNGSAEAVALAMLGAMR